MNSHDNKQILHKTELSSVKEPSSIAEPSFMKEPSSITEIQDLISAQISLITHEIRNPVTLISTYLYLMAEKHPEIREFDYWDHVTSNMEFLKVLLNDISSLNNAHTLHKEMVNIHQFLSSLTQELTPHLNQNNHTITLKKRSALPPLELDTTKFRQALLNLIRNSAEAMENGGEISISVYFKDLSIMIEIQDEGPGIPNEYLPTLFEPFVTHKKEGTGLGLAIARNLLEAHGGNIRVNTSTDTGTCFILQLPI